MTPKQARFVEEYTKDWNATQAAIRAGYSKRTAYSIGQENLYKPEISKAIEARKAELTMSSDEVLTRLTEQARGVHGEYLKADGTVDLDSLLADGMGHLIKGFKHTRNGLNVEFHDAQSALVHIGKTHGMFTKKIDVTSGGEKLQPIAILAMPVDEL